MNFDLKRIKAIIENTSSGKAEYIGPPFKFFNEDKLSVVEIKATPYEVQLWISKKASEFSFEITMQDIEYLLTQKGIKSGIDWDVVSRHLKRGERDRYITIARAQSPVDGVAGSIQEKIKVDKDAKPIILEGGQADFRNISKIQQIKKNDLIAVRYPPTPGVDGKDVYGEVIKAVPGSDVEFFPGDNTVLSGDGNELRAASPGYLYRDSGKICVGLLYVVQGDVDFKSGNIKYEGDVHVQGNVLPGFEVNATGMIIIEGQVDSARIESLKESVIIKQGVFGKDKGVIAAAKNIDIFLIQDCSINAGGTVTVKKSLANCKVKAKNFIATDHGCIVIASEIRIDDKCEIYQVGNKQETTTVILFEDKGSETLKSKIQQCETLLFQIDAILDTHEKQLRSLRLKIKQEKNPDDIDTLKKGIDDYTLIQRKKELLSHEIVRLTGEFNTPHDLPNILTFKIMYPEVRVEMYGRYGVFNNEMRDVQVKVDHDKIVTTPLVVQR